MPHADAQSMLERLEAAGHGDLGRAIRRALGAGAEPPFALSWRGSQAVVTEDYQVWEMSGNVRGTRYDRVPAQDDCNERKRRSFRCSDEVWAAIPEPKASWVEEVIVAALTRR